METELRVLCDVAIPPTSKLKGNPMKHRWAEDNRFLDDLDLLVQASEDDWHIIAYIRWDIRAKRYRCRFLGMADDEFPDGKTFKTKRGAKNFCERHLPAMWIRHCANTGDDE